MPQAQADAMGSPASDAAAATARPLVFDASAPAPNFGAYELSWIGTSTPQPGGQKRAATTSPMGMPPRQGRSQSPWPVPNLRLVHQRVEMPGGDSELKDVVTALVKQHEHDRDFIDQLKDSIVALHDRLMNHDRQISKWRVWSEDDARKFWKSEDRVQQGQADYKLMMEDTGLSAPMRYPSGVRPFRYPLELVE